MQKVLVTGGAGFIGAHLVEKLVKNKYNVMVVDNLKGEGGVPYINPKCFFFKGCILDYKTHQEIRKFRPEIIYHLAAQSAGEISYDDPKYDFLINGYGTYLMCIIAKQLKIKYFVYSSSVAVYGSNLKVINEKTEINPNSLYGISKYTGEMFIRQILYPLKIKTRILRIFNTYGPGENLNNLKKGMLKIYISYIWKKKPIDVKGSLNRKRNFIYIADCIDILFRSILNKKLKKNEIINISNFKKITVKKLLGKIFKIFKLKDYKIHKKESTLGDSFSCFASGNYFKRKFDGFIFTDLQAGIKKYYEWLKLVARTKKNIFYHPLYLHNINNKNN